MGRSLRSSTYLQFPFASSVAYVRVHPCVNNKHELAVFTTGYDNGKTRRYEGGRGCCKQRATEPRPLAGGSARPIIGLSNGSLLLEAKQQRYERRFVRSTAVPLHRAIVQGSARCKGKQSLVGRLEERAGRLGVRTLESKTSKL